MRSAHSELNTGIHSSAGARVPQRTGGEEEAFVAKQPQPSSAADLLQAVAARLPTQKAFVTAGTNVSLEESGSLHLLLATAFHAVSGHSSRSRCSA